MRAKMGRPAARARDIIKLRGIKPSAEAICAGDRIPIMADEIVNENFSRWYGCRDLEQVLDLGHHG